MSGIPKDNDVRRLTKLLERKTNILESMFSGERNEYVIKQRHLERIKGHHITLSDVHDYFKTLLEHVGYDVRPNNGLSIDSKEVRISGEAFKRAKMGYEFFKN